MFKKTKSYFSCYLNKIYNYKIQTNTKDFSSKLNYFLNNSEHQNTSELKNKITQNPEIDKWSSLFTLKQEKSLKNSLIRSLDIGHNYFRHVSPKRKKNLLTLLNSYLRVINESKDKNNNDFSKALDFFYNNHSGQMESYLNSQDLESLNCEVINHLFSITVFERLASQISRVDYTDYHNFIKELNEIPKEKRNKSKYVFTSHPTQPNSMDQIIATIEILKAMEENDLDYLQQSMKSFVDSVFNRAEFKKPSYLDESNVYHSMAIPNIINAFSMGYELGFKDPQDFFEIPGTWITFDFDNHPEMSVGIMSHTHGLNLELTINCYVKIILEAEIVEIPEIQQILEIFHKIVKYSKKIRELSEQVRTKKINKNEFFIEIPITNIHSLEIQITNLLETISNDTKSSIKANYTANKLLKLIKVFRFSTCLGQVRLAGEELYERNSIKELVHDIFKEISILNTNCSAADMLIIANYQSEAQYENVKYLLEKYNVQGIEIVPLLETFSATNDTDSKITMIASSDTRQRDGLLLTELRVLREFTNNPDKYIYMGQGITAERGGGPFHLLHQKYISLTKSQRKRHIRTIQGFYFTSEYASKDFVFVNILNGSRYINLGDAFKPSTEYMDFLFDLDSTVGVPTRKLQKTEEFNDFYVKNPYIKTLVDLYDYSGSRELSKKLVNVKNTRAIVQAYINSDRCSYTHPELSYWNRLTPEQIKEITKYYYENNKHFIYILYNLGFLVRRFDLNFATNSLKLDANNSCLKIYKSGTESLEALLNHLGIGKNSSPISQIYKQHLGLSKEASNEELILKEWGFKNLFKLQNSQIDIYLNESNEEKRKIAERKIRILQQTLSNFSQFNGKG